MLVCLQVHDLINKEKARPAEPSDAIIPMGIVEAKAVQTVLVYLRLDDPICKKKARPAGPSDATTPMGIV